MAVAEMIAVNTIRISFFIRLWAIFDLIFTYFEAPVPVELVVPVMAVVSAVLLMTVVLLTTVEPLLPPKEYQ